MYRKTQSVDVAKKQFFDVYVSNNESSRTLYILGPYGGRKIYFYLLLIRLIKLQYRVVFMQVDSRVLSTQHPEYLELAIVEARRLIHQDRYSVSRKSDYLLGISLGSYLGLSVLLTEKFTKFVVVGGGAPLVGVFRSHRMFKTERKKIRKHQQEERVYSTWVKFDEAFKAHSLTHLSVLALNSKSDRVIPSKNLDTFNEDLKNTGARVIDQRQGNLPHVPQVLSVNFRARQIHNFLTKS